MGKDVRQGFSTPKDEENLRQMILKMKGFEPTQIKHLFPNVQEADIDEVLKKLNEKFNKLKKEIIIFNPNTLTRLTPEEFNTKMSEHIAEMTIQYDKTGLEKIYKKITKVLTEIPSTDEYKEDLAIVREIKKEYVETKKMPKSTMLYLNKIHRQLTQDKENGKIDNETLDALLYSSDRFGEHVKRGAKHKWHID